ncbi:MAG: lysostaphin resistance A-like protein [Novosphingobium sp.]
MAQIPSAEGTAPAWRQWAAVAGGLLIASGWIAFIIALAPALMGDGSNLWRYAVFMLMIYVPLLPIALIGGWLCRSRVLRLGQSPGVWMAAGILIGAGGVSASLLMSWLNGGVVPGSGMSGFSLAVGLGMMLTLVQASMEEVLFRGWLQPVLAARWGAMAGVLASALLFALFHLIGGARAPVTLAFIMLAGVLFGLLTQRTGGLAASVAAHAAWNITEGSVFGLVPNPGTELFGSILDFDLAGPPIWGGSDEGLNASVGTLMVMAAMLLPLLAIGLPRSGTPTRPGLPV